LKDYFINGIYHESFEASMEIGHGLETERRQSFEIKGIGAMKIQFISDVMASRNRESRYTEKRDSPCVIDS
jgi:hypothetical protein